MTVIDAEYQTTTLPAVTQSQSLSVPAPPQAPMSIFGDITTPEGFQRAIQAVENGMKLRRHITQLAVATGQAESWIDMDGSPYCTEAECERILAMIGASVTLLRKTLEPEDDGNYGVEVEVRLEHPLLGAWTGIGYAHTADPFLGTNSGRSRRKLDEVSRHNIQQHAYTRAKGDLTRKLMGLSGYTWETLYSQFGFECGKGGSIEFLKNRQANREQTLSGTRPRASEVGRQRKAERAEREERTAAEGKGQASQPAPAATSSTYKADLTNARREAGVSFGDITTWTTAELGYSGKALEAPEEHQARILEALRDGEIKGSSNA